MMWVREALLRATASGDIPHLFDPVAADAEHLVVLIDGRVAVRNYQLELVTNVVRLVRCCREPDAAKFIRTGVVAHSWFTNHSRIWRIQRECFCAGIRREAAREAIVQDCR